MLKTAPRIRSRTPTVSTVVAQEVQPRTPLNVLIASHGHPRLSKGGAEIAAYDLFMALKARPQYEARFLGCVRDEMNQKLGATISQPFSDREYLYAAGAFDWFKFSNADPNFPREFRSLLKALQPRILHFHHYIVFGVEAILHVREVLPECKIVMTLHEYLALCHHFGQMVTKQHTTLCYESTPIRCSGCFKELTPSDFFLRNVYIRRFFDLIDHFIAPSQFLADRYIAWGVSPEKMSVIENVMHRDLCNESEPKREKSGPLRVGYFGQVSILKGVGLLLDVADILEKRNEYNVVFEIFGDYSRQPPEFQAQFLARLEKAGRNVIFHGPYDQNRVDELMRLVDVVVTPSIWWENSPVVIQEALRNRRPVVCSNIGGMAEKVRDGVDGFHFPVGNSFALASLLLDLAETPEKLAQIEKSMRVPVAQGEVISRYERLYESLIS